MTNMKATMMNMAVDRLRLMKIIRLYHYPLVQSGVLLPSTMLVFLSPGLSARPLRQSCFRLERTSVPVLTK